MCPISKWTCGSHTHPIPFVQFWMGMWTTDILWNHTGLFLYTRPITFWSLRKNLRDWTDCSHTTYILYLVPTNRSHNVHIPVTYFFVLSRKQKRKSKPLQPRKKLEYKFYNFLAQKTPFFVTFLPSIYLKFLCDKTGILVLSGSQKHEKYYFWRKIWLKYD